MRKLRVWLAVLVGVLGFGLCSTLGVLQLARWQTKQDMLAKITALQSASPITIREALAKTQANEDITFVHIQDNGHFLYGNNLFMQSDSQESPGWQVLTPFLSDSGVAILASRGTVPDALRKSLVVPQADSITVDAILVKHRGAQGLFDPDNEPEQNNWYWWDIPAMLATASVPAETTITRYVLQLLPHAANTQPPYAIKPEQQTENNHLMNALIWFALALSLAVMPGFAVYRFRKHRSRIKTE